MLLNNRIIWSDNGTPKDLSAILSSFASGTQVIDFVAAEDSIFIGSDMPFNHRYFQPVVDNDQASLALVSIWTGNAFEATVDSIDQTLDAGGTKSMSKNGILSWVPDRTKYWARQETTERVTGLETLKIYNMYWAKLNFSADLKSTFSLAYVGHRFCNDDDLYSRYPDLANTDLLNSFKSGKSDWVEQQVLASEIVVRDLRADEKLWSINQVLEWERFQEAACYKTAELAYSAFGKDYADDVASARKYYKEALGQSRGGIDLDGNGSLKPFEQVSQARIMRR